MVGTRDDGAYKILHELLVQRANLLPLIASRTEYAIGVESVRAAAREVGYGGGRVLDLLEIEGAIRGGEKSSVLSSRGIEYISLGWAVEEGLRNVDKSLGTDLTETEILEDFEEKRQGS